MESKLLQHENEDGDPDSFLDMLYNAFNTFYFKEDSQKNVRLKKELWTNEINLLIQFKSCSVCPVRTPMILYSENQRGEKSGIYLEAIPGSV